MTKHNSERNKIMRLLHTMLRVGNLERSLDFYQNVLNMQLLRRRDYPEGRFTLAFVGYGDEADHTVLELTHNWDTESYVLMAISRLKSMMLTRRASVSKKWEVKWYAKPAR